MGWILRGQAWFGAVPRRARVPVPRERDAAHSQELNQDGAKPALQMVFSNSKWSGESLVASVTSQSHLARFGLDHEIRGKG